MSQTAPTEKVTSIEVGRTLALGRVFQTITLPDNTVLEIKRMGMNSEMLFIEQFNKFVKAVADEKASITTEFKKFMDASGDTKQIAQFGIIEGLEFIGRMLTRLPALHVLMIETVQIILRARKITRSNEDLMELMSTADVVEIINAQGEAQGLLGLFRGIAQGLGALSQGK
jgi:hypothetical protein